MALITSVCVPSAAIISMIVGNYFNHGLCEFGSPLSVGAGALLVGWEEEEEEEEEEEKFLLLLLLLLPRQFCSSLELSDVSPIAQTTD